MIKAVLVGIVIAVAVNGFAEEVLREIPWQELADGGRLPTGRIVEDACLKVESSGDTLHTFKALTMGQLGITAPSYAIAGTIRYENVEGEGYLEMWSHFGEGKAFFSRTLAGVGPMRSLTGSSDWREFTLPFYVRDEKGWLPDRPEGLELNVVLPGKGTVWIGSCRLIQNLDGADGGESAWWSAAAGGLIGGLGGSLIGVLGAVVGVLAGKGRARGLALALLYVLMFVGIVSLAMGMVALTRLQSYAVFYPLLLLGGITTVVGGGLLPIVRRRYRVIELRRMLAADAQPQSNA